MDLQKWRLKRTYLSTPLFNQSFGLAFLAQILMLAFSLWDWSRGIPEKSLFAASFTDVFYHHQYYRLFTAIFAHASWDHILGNALFFIPFLALLVNYFGALMLPFVFVAGALINLIVIDFYPQDFSVLGVSGAVYFMVAFWLVLYMGIERGLSFKQRTLRAIGLVLVEFMPERFDMNVSYLSHFVGFLLGVVLGVLYFLYFRRNFRAFEQWELIEQESEPEVFDISSAHF